jgi:hypothetical protein
MVTSFTFASRVFSGKPIYLISMRDDESTTTMCTQFTPLNVGTMYPQEPAEESTEKRNFHNPRTTNEWKKSKEEGAKI